MKYWPNGRSRWLKIDSSPVLNTTRSMRTKNAEKRIFKKKEANIQPFDQKSLLLHVLFGRGPNKVMETACFDVTAVNLKKVGMASRNIVIKKQYTLLWISFTVIPAAPSFPRSDPQALAFFFALDGKLPGGGDSWAVKSPGVGTKKEGKCLVTPSILQHFSLIAQSNNTVLSILCAIFRFN